MDVWYKLDDHQASSLTFKGDHVDHLNRAIKEEAANTLKGVETFLRKSLLSSRVSITTILRFTVRYNVNRQRTIAHGSARYCAVMTQFSQFMSAPRVRRLQNRFRAFSSTEHITVSPSTVNSSSSTAAVTTTEL